MSIDDIVPALAPLHPGKPEPRLTGIWRKRATGKTTVNAPCCAVLRRTEKGIVIYQRIGWAAASRSSERVFRRDWEPA